MNGVLTSLASLVNEGVFGDVQFVNAAFKDASKDIGAQFASSLGFVDLTVKCKSGEKLLPLVIKIQCDAMGNDIQFHNELVMYQQVIPALGFDQQSYPLLHYGKVGEKKTDENILIFQDLRSRQFVNSKEPLFLDFEHISIAIKKIAIFHSLSFNLKHRDAEKFHELIALFRSDYQIDTEFANEHILAIERGVKAYQERNGVDEVFDELLKTTKDTIKVWTDLLSPEEPFAVICHGDFCNNNVMFKYEEDGIPTDCALIDFQRAGYISLGAELAFYLYMHTTSDVREKHWDEFLKIYWDTLKENLSQEVEISSFEDFLVHFSGRAFFGYSVASFFLPVMMVDDELRSTALMEENKEMLRDLGGKEAEEKLADILSHMYHKKYIHAFLDLTNHDENQLIK